MLFFLGQANHHEVPSSKRSMKSGMLSAGLLFLLLGAAIISAPDLLAYFVAGFFVIMGISILTAWWNIRRL